MLVLVITGSLLSVGVYGSIHIVQRFDPNRMLPQDSYLSKWIRIQQDYYAEYGFQVWVSQVKFCKAGAGARSWHLDFYKLTKLVIC